MAVRFATEQKAAKDSQSPDGRREVERGLGAVLDLLPKSVAEDPRNEDWEDRWFDLIDATIRLHRQVGDEAKAAFDRVDARLGKIAGIEALRLAVKGNFLMHWGWEARTRRSRRRSPRSSSAPSRRGSRRPGLRSMRPGRRNRMSPTSRT